MKLQYSPNSPYVRKVVVLADELGLNDRIERVAVTLSPYDPNPDVVALNPLGKIPVLTTDEGQDLFGSVVCSEYLSFLAGDTKWFPAPGKDRWHALKCNALSEGMLEAAQLARFEGARPEQFRYAKWSDAMIAKLHRSFAHLDKALPADEDFGAIAVASAIGWLDFRFPELAWRDKSPALAGWFAKFSERPSFATSRHPGQ